MIVYDKLSHMGRLGNICLEVASTIGIADTLGIDYGFNECNWPFDSKLPIFKAPDHRFNEYPYMEFRKEVYEQGTNFTIEGYYQSEKYFAHCREKILSFFKFPEATEKHIAKKYQLALRLNPVSFHVRRGDYISQNWYVGDQWYLDRMGELNGRLVMVFSDDTQYCEGLFKAFPNVMYIYEDAINSMCLMSKCQSHVISNSTFSWFPAWMSGSTDVVYPDRFDSINNGNSTFPNKDFYPERWTKR